MANIKGFGKFSSVLYDSHEREVLMLCRKGMGVNSSNVNYEKGENLRSYNVLLITVGEKGEMSGRGCL